MAAAVLQLGLAHVDRAVEEQVAGGGLEGFGPTAWTVPAMWLSPLRLLMVAAVAEARSPR